MSKVSMLSTRQNSQAIMSYTLLILIAIIWGSQFFFIHQALLSLTPLAIAAIRTCVGAFTVAMIVLFTPRKKTNVLAKEQRKKIWLYYAVIAIFEAVLPFFLVPWGQQHIDASIAAILLGTIPIFTLIFATSFIPEEKWTRSAVFSVAVGFSGIMVLLLPSIKGGWFSSVETLLGELAVLLGAACFAASIILLKKLPVVSPLVAVRNILFLAAIPLVIMMAFHDLTWVHALRWQSLLAVGVLGIFNAGIVYVMYLILIHRAGPTFASLTNYLVPFIGVLIGFLFMGEMIHWNELLSMGLVLAALWVSRFA